MRSSQIGSLLYLATNRRPDKAACIEILSKKVSSPSEAELVYTKDYVLKLGDVTLEFELTGYCDGDWRSCCGYLFRIVGATISWKQCCVTTSTMEAGLVTRSYAGGCVVARFTRGTKCEAGQADSDR